MGGADAPGERRMKGRCGPFSLPEEWMVRVSYKHCARILSLVAVSLLGLALLVRAFSALVEAAAVLLLAAAVAALALPHGLAWYWRRARTEIPRVLRLLSDIIEPAAPPASAEGTEAEPEKAEAGRGGPDGPDDKTPGAAEASAKPAPPKAASGTDQVFGKAGTTGEPGACPERGGKAGAVSPGSAADGAAPEREGSEREDTEGRSGDAVRS